MNTNYREFAQEYAAWITKNKIEITSLSGMEVDRAGLHPRLREYQKDVVLWALRIGHGLIAAKFGLGKTTMQIEILRQVKAAVGGAQLVICPLGVRQQFTHEDGPQMGVTFRYVRNDAEAQAAMEAGAMLITNYERVRDGGISEDWITANLTGVCMDEAAILGNLGTKTLEQFRRIFDGVQYKWAATATPAPNDYRQMIYFGDFFDEMDQGQALTRFFFRNPDKAADLQIMPHMELEFWMFVSSWALFIEKPSDIDAAYSDDGFSMPELEIIWHRLTSDHEKAWSVIDRDGQAFLLNDTTMGISNASVEKRSSMDARMAEAHTIISAHPDRNWLLWHHLEDERRMIEKMFHNASTVYGSQDLDKREQIILDFSHGRLPMLASKPEITGQGCNFQYACKDAVYVGLNFKFRDFIQSLHRIWRYGQTGKVTVHIIHTDAEDSVRDALERKWKMHDELMAKMRGIVAEFGLTRESLTNGLRRAIGVQRREKAGDTWQVFNNDTVLECYGMRDNSIDGIVTSIPFGNHYEYSANMNDFGYNQTDDVFWTQMDFLIPSLYRALKPGRMACIHVKDRLLYGHQTPHGLMEVDYFSDACNAAFKKHGFVCYGRITIPTDVVRENKSTNRLGWSENAKDSTKMGVGMPEYVLLFRKPQTDKTRSYGDEPVTKTKTGEGAYSRAAWQVDAHSLWGSNGATVADFPPMLTQDEIDGMEGSQLYNFWRHRMQKGTPYNHAEHVKFCEMIGDRLPATFMLAPVWMPEDEDQYVWTDILFMRTLNMQNARRRLAKHVCPFPLDIPRRLIVRYTNPGDVVLDPFSGLGTVGVVAIEEGRRYVGVELNQDYFDISAKYLTEAETIKNGRMSLFDMSAIDRVKIEPDFFADVAHMPELAMAAD
jgi:DNA modification methylase